MPTINITESFTRWLVLEYATQYILYDFKSVDCCALAITSKPQLMHEWLAIATVTLS